MFGLGQSYIAFIYSYTNNIGLCVVDILKLALNGGCVGITDQKTLIVLEIVGRSPVLRRLLRLGPKAAAIKTKNILDELMATI
jgi:hypothetical protein